MPGSGTVPRGASRPPAEGLGAEVPDGKSAAPVLAPRRRPLWGHSDLAGRAPQAGRGARRRGPRASPPAVRAGADSPGLSGVPQPPSGRRAPPAAVYPVWRRLAAPGRVPARTRCAARGARGSAPATDWPGPEEMNPPEVQRRRGGPAGRRVVGARPSWLARRLARANARETSPADRSRRMLDRQEGDRRPGAPFGGWRAPSRCCSSGGMSPTARSRVRWRPGCRRRRQRRGLDRRRRDPAAGWATHRASAEGRLQGRARWWGCPRPPDASLRPPDAAGRWLSDCPSTCPCRSRCQREGRPRKDGHSPRPPPEPPGGGCPPRPGFDPRARRPRPEQNSALARRVESQRPSGRGRPTGSCGPRVLPGSATPCEARRRKASTAPPHGPSASTRRRATASWVVALLGTPGRVEPRGPTSPRC
jgi:hypothetical protein